MRPVDDREGTPLAVQAIEVASTRAIALDTASTRLLYVVRGRLAVDAEDSRWLVRRDRAFWVPGGTSVRLTTQSDAHVLMVHPVRGVHRAMGPVVVSTLLRAALTRLTTLATPVHHDVIAEGHLAAVIADELARLPDEPALVPLPCDERLRALAVRLQDASGLHLTLPACSRDAGMSARTLSRLVQQQTGLSFGRWRRRLHLASAVTRLSAGESVNSVAYAVGYSSPSAFITMFRRAFGLTPSQYAERVRAGGSPGPPGLATPSEAPSSARRVRRVARG